ncbi:MAG: phosphatidylserine/phosphatidylglycerophosphate/cardiolipin synthase family protein [Acidobacteria bacterium]|nr:phosphatidylserine/phosphatidylglycerophosphate/cardiolipin synthase family protein [Acidobacteriota bacterium]
MPKASALVPLWDRTAEWQRRLAMIDDARVFLYLTTFYIEHDAYGTTLLAALRAAQRRGVAVTLVVDAFGQRLGGVLMSAGQREALTNELHGLRADGGTVTVYAPPHQLQRLLGGGQHVKIQVSEAGDAIFGSSNVTTSSFEGWNEFAVAVRGPVAAVLLESIRAIGGTVAAAHIAHLTRLDDGAAANLELDYWLCNPNARQGWRGPFGWHGRNEVTERMVEMLDSAHHTARVTSFYFKPVEPLLEAVLRAARRGVRVEVFHSHRQALPATDLAWIAAASTYDRLLDAGVAVYENRHGEHSKLVVVDDAWAAFGSYNFEDAAHDRLAEAMLASRDRRAVAPVAAIFDELRVDPDNVPVTPAWRNDLPPRSRARVARYGRFKWWM